MEDFDGRALGQELRGLIESEGSAPSTSDAAGSTPAAPAETAGGAPSVDAATPPAPVQGSTPEAQPPASAAQASTYDALVARYGDKDRAASEFFALEQRIAAMAKQLKAQDATPAPAVAEPAATGTQVQAQPAPVAAPRQDAVPAPEPPVSDEVPPDVEQLAFATAAEDTECVSLQSQYTANKEAIKQLVDRDPRTKEIIGGALPALAEQIYLLQINLDPAKRKAAGLHDLDEFQQNELADRLRKLETEHASKELQLDRLFAHNDRLSASYDGRLGRIRQWHQGQYDEQRQEAERQAQLEIDSKSFVSEWSTTADTVFKNLNVSAADQPDILEDARVAAEAWIARNPGVPIQNLSGFIERVAKRELAKAERVHRSRSAEDARLKRADVAQPAPKGSAAVAAPLPTDAPDWEDRLKADHRQERRALAS